MKYICLVASFIFLTSLNAQYSVRLVVTGVATRGQEDVYVTGNFNNWNPKDENYKLKPSVGGRKAIVLKDLPAGTYAFKFTRGGADKLETTADGRDISDRILEVSADDSKEYTIAGWKDDYPDKPKPYTASPQVKIIDTAFAIPQLGRTRRIWIYLPKGYATSSKTYPVLYMQDGQNLFNEQTAFAGEWGIDECLDTLQQKTGKECIIVGIDNGGSKRMNEYNPYDHAQYGKGEGDQYLAFLVNTLKPYIDQKYRTRKGVATTFIAGSSMGALISFYALLKHPDVFGGAGVFSPSFPVAPGIFTEAEKFTPPPGTLNYKCYLYAGKQESADMVPAAEKMAAILQKKAGVYTRLLIYPLGKHNEATWRQEFASFYSWLMN